MKYLLLAIACYIAGLAIAGAHAQTAPSESWRYDFNADSAVTIGDAITVIGHVGETYTLPGPCHRFVAFATPVTLPDGTTMDGYFSDDLTAPPSRDYLTC